MNTNKWLLERSKVLMKYAETTPACLNRLSMTLEEPECGWIDAYFKVNGKFLNVELSSVYEPFVPLKEWMEDIVKQTSRFTYGISMVQIDCEGYQVMLYYEPIPFCDWRITQGRNCGILYIYDGAEEKVALDAFCETEELLKAVYTAVIQYAKDMQQCSVFIEDWVWMAYNAEMADMEEDSSEMKEFFYNKVRSEIVEKFLQLDNK